MKFCEERKVESIGKNELEVSAKFVSPIKYYSQGRRPLKFQMNWKKKIKRNSIDVRKISCHMLLLEKFCELKCSFSKWMVTERHHCFYSHLTSSNEYIFAKDIFTRVDTSLLISSYLSEHLHVSDVFTEFQNTLESAFLSFGAIHCSVLLFYQQYLL